MKNNRNRTEWIVTEHKREADRKEQQEKRKERIANDNNKGDLKIRWINRGRKQNREQKGEQRRIKAWIR